MRAAPKARGMRPFVRFGRGKPVRRLAAGHDGGLAGWMPRRVTRYSEGLDRATLQTRSEDIIANDGHAASVARTMVTNTVGIGLAPQSTLDHEALGISEDAARAVARDQERAFRLWSQEAHVGRRLHFEDCQALTIHETVAQGEYLWIGRTLSEQKTRAKGRRFSFCLQEVHPLRLRTPAHLVGDDSIRDGVVMDEDGEDLGYWIENSRDVWGGMDDYVYCPARAGHRRLVFHAYRMESPEQVRGVPLLAPVIKLFRDKYDFLDYEVMAQIITSAFPVAIESTAPLTEGNMYQGTQQPRYFQQVHPGQIFYPNPGESVKALTANRPGNNFEAFFKIILRTITAVAGLPYEQVARDFSDTNYSSARAALLEAWRVYQEYRHWLLRHFCKPVRAQVLEEAWLRGYWSIPKGAPDFYGHMDLWLASRWTPPPRGHVDPLKEIEANILGLRAGLLTYADLLGEQGVDYEDAFAQQFREQRLRQSLGLPQDLTTNASATKEEAS